MERVCYVYVLHDPRNNNKCYIGRSFNPKIRYNAHVANSSLHTKTKKNSWILKLKKLGLQPELEIIASFPESEWRLQECYYIELYKRLGFCLTNGDNGGVGRDRGLQHSQEVIKKMSGENNHGFGKKRSQEVKDKISKTMKEIRRLNPRPKTVTSEETKQKIREKAKNYTHILTAQKIRTEKYKNKTYNEAYGKEKAEKIKLKSSISHIEYYKKQKENDI